MGQGAAVSRMSRRAWLRQGGACLAAAASGSTLLTACDRSSSPVWLTSEGGGWVGAQAARGHRLRDGAPVRLSDDAQTRRVHTVIVGGGVAGLSAARVLRQAGLDDFVLLELEDQIGGNARGHQMGGLPCPLGAHYLPVPGAHAQAVAQWLQELGVIHHRHGRWVGDERHLCHSPQERLFVPDTSVASSAAPAGVWPGQWHEGLMSAELLSREDRRQFEVFHQRVRQTAQACAFAMPTGQAPWHAGHQALDAITFALWLDQAGLTSRPLRWYLDYACRDDYGAGLSRVSAWAGLQYFASRHDVTQDGWQDDASPVLTWPEGNAWLTRQLSQGLGERVQAGHVTVQVNAARHGVQVWSWSEHAQRHICWEAQQVILAVPLFVAQRLLGGAVAALNAHALRQRHAPWLVSNLLLREPLLDRTGAPMAWDNVVFTSQSPSDVGIPALGYVQARHQSLAMPVGPHVLTHYWALGGESEQQGRHWRQALMRDPWQTWAARVVADLSAVHPDLGDRVSRIDLMRYGHAMAIPEPGVRSAAALVALQRPQGPQGRIHFAHADLSAYSVFEEAFTHGVRAAHQVLSAAGISRRII